MLSRSAGLIIITFLSLYSCKKDSTDPIPNPLNNCTMLNGTMSWDFDGNSYCANSSIIAAKSTALTLNGITLTGITITLELDSINPGTYNMSSVSNNLLFTDQLGNAWTPVDASPGSITVTKNDTTLNRFEATFNCIIKSPITGVTKQISNGSVRVFYIE